MKKIKQKRKDYPPGAFVPFVSYFPELFERETRKVVLLQEMYGLPAGLYFLFESYCVDKDCDCRKVMINVLPEGDIPSFSDTIGFGWENEKFYSKWVGDGVSGSQMAGAYLEPGRINTDCGEKYLELVKNSLRDPHYVNLIRKYYESFKNMLKEDQR